MKKLLAPLMLVIPAALYACGGQESADELADEAASLALSSDDPDADANTEAALGANDMDLDEAASDRSDAMTQSEPQEVIFSCNFSELRAQVIARFDTDGDGRLNAEERAELRDELDDHPRLRLARRLLLGAGGRRPHFHVWKRIRWAFDVNNDGQLDAEERAALIEASEARCERRKAEFTERFDTDGDGTLSRDEVVAGLHELRSRWQDRRADFLAQYDTNGDGTLDDAERAAVREDIRARRDQIRMDVKSRFDLDMNGRLDDAEIAALKAEIRRLYVEGFQNA